MNHNRIFIALFSLTTVCSAPVWGQTESASSAVKNMKIGWNLGNTLESNSGSVDNMWIELWSQRKPNDYETAWGQKTTTKELIKMFKDAGFNAIRVPVTWYPHMGTVSVSKSTDSKGIWDKTTWTGYDIDEAWMNRVKEVVDYVISNGMYCILNVHHDTGDATTTWVVADEDVYNNEKERFEALWTTIATTFKEYDEHLLFEGYNEMLDASNSWCFASMKDGYNATKAKSAYNGVNSFAQSFVSAVRATGGNNATRNLICCTYGACCGDGTWSEHLVDPLTEMKLPTDNVEGHLIYEVHYYPYFKSLSQAKTSVDNVISTLNTYLDVKSAPLIFGEWGAGSGDGAVNFDNNAEVFCSFAQYFVEKTKENNMGTFYWMGLSDGEARSVPEFNEAQLKDAIVKGYYGENGYKTAINDKTIYAADNIVDVYSLSGQKLLEKVKFGELPNLLKSGLYIVGNKKCLIR